ncbi:MAG: NB-ARC domain-containing protein [Promethearchaeota archaeon]
MNIQKLEEKIKKIEDLIKDTHYKNSVEDCLSIIENLLKYLYKEVVLSLSINEKELLFVYEKNVGKSVNKMMIGELIGLFSNNSLLEKLSSKQGKKFIYLTYNNLNHLNNIRISCTHEDYECSYSEANFIYFTLRNILDELELFEATNISEDFIEEEEIQDASEVFDIRNNFSLKHLPRPEYIKFIGRENYIEEIIEKLIGRTYIVSIDGIGGVGKSALAHEVGEICWDRQLFNSVIWVSAKKQKLRINGIHDITPDISNFYDLLDTILEIYGIEDYQEYSIETKRRRVYKNLQCIKTLLIVDNLETVDDPEIFNFLMELPEPSKILITSRKRLGEVERVVVLKEFNLDETKEFLNVECTEKGIEFIEIIEKNLVNIHKVTGGIPLALKLIVGWLASGLSINKILEKISNRDSELLEFCFNEAYNNLLTEKSKKVFSIFPIFSGDLVLKDQIEAASNLHKEELDEALSQLIQLSLINLEKEFDEEENIEQYYYNMLPLTLNFAYKKLTENKGLEGDARKRLARYFELHLKPKDALMHYRKTFFKEIDLKTEKGKTAAILSNLAFSTYQRGDYRKAKQLFKQAIETDPKLSYSYQLWATVERQQGNYSYAEQLFADAAKLNPKNSIIWSSWAMMKKDVKDFNGAIELLIKGIKISKTKDEILFQQLAVVESMRGNYDEAVKIASNNIIDNPKSKKERYLNTCLITSLLETYWKWALDLFKERKYSEGYLKLESALEESKRNIQKIFKNNIKYLGKIKKIFHTFGIKKSQGRMYDEAEELLKKAYYRYPRRDFEFYHNCLVNYHRLMNYYYWDNKNEVMKYYQKIKDCKSKFPKFRNYVKQLESKIFS